MKYAKRILLGTFFMMIATTLTACQQADGGDGGFFQQYLVNPFTEAIHGIAGIFGDSYGIAIIIITILIRLALMPFMLKQYKRQQEMKVKMEKLKPEMKEIQDKLKKAKDKQEQQKLQQEMMSLYQKHGVNPLNMGCLPLLLQMPILMGLYYAIRNSADISSHSFLWFSLGEPDLIITAIAGIVYYFQFKLTQVAMPAEQQQQLKMIGLLSPIMIVVVSFSAPAALPLYWVVGGLFLMGQTVLGRKLYPPITEDEAEKGKG